MIRKLLPFLLLSSAVTTSATTLVYADETDNSGFQTHCEKKQGVSVIKIKKVIDAYVSSHAFQGSVLVGKSGCVVFKGSYGLANQQKKLPNTDEASFLLASLSKPITAVLVMKLIEQGKLSLEDNLAQYYPQFNKTKYNQITLHHLLSNRSGIPNHFEIPGWQTNQFKNTTSEAEFINIVAQLPLRFEPGSDYLYSNPGYFLLGKIAEKVTGMSYESSLRKYIFSPVGMNNSGVARSTESDVLTVNGYRWKDKGGFRQQDATNMTLMGAGAAIYSNTSDLYKFDLALSNNSLLSDESKKSLFNKQQPYAWNFQQVNFNDELTVSSQSYNGQFEGYSSMMTRFPDEQISIILLSNVGTSYTMKSQLTLDIAKELYGVKLSDRSKEASLYLIKNIVAGSFEQAIEKMESGSLGLSIDESKVTELAFQLLWSGLSDKSLQMIAMLNHLKPSPQVKNSLDTICGHGLAKDSQVKASVCN